MGVIVIAVYWCASLLFSKRPTDRLNSKITVYSSMKIAVTVKAVVGIGSTLGSFTVMFMRCFRKC